MGPLTRSGAASKGSLSLRVSLSSDSGWAQEARAKVLVKVGTDVGNLWTDRSGLPLWHHLASFIGRTPSVSNLARSAFHKSIWCIFWSQSELVRFEALRSICIAKTRRVFFWRWKVFGDAWQIWLLSSVYLRHSARSLAWPRIPCHAISRLRYLDGII